MTILDKLMEKKDLRIYVDLRIKQLLLHIKNINDYNESAREGLKQRFSAKIDEMQRLKEILERDSLKQDCKIIYNHVENKKELNIRIR